MTVGEYYRWIFENSVPWSSGSRGRNKDLTPLEYMRKYGAFLIEDNVYKVHETGLKSSDLVDATTDPVTQCYFQKRLRFGSRYCWRSCIGFPDTVPQAGVLFQDAKGVEMAGICYPRLHQESRSLGQHGFRQRRRDASPADIPIADVDSHALRQREVVVRDLPPKPTMDQSEGCAESWRQHRRTIESPHRNRLFRR